MLNASASLAAKKAGIQLALDMSGDWPAQVLPELEAWLVARRAAGRETFTLEQFRAAALNVPASHKAWGSLPRLACAAGLIEPAVRGDGSPVMQPAESVRTHGHFVRVWKILGTRATSEQHTDASAAPRQPSGIACVGAVGSSVGGEAR